MGKEIEGKGRQKQLEREDQYEEARTLLAEALDLLPPSGRRNELDVSTREKLRVTVFQLTLCSIAQVTRSRAQA